MYRRLTPILFILAVTGCVAEQKLTAASENPIAAAVANSQNQTTALPVKMVEVAGHNFGLEPTDTGCTLLIEGQSSVELGLSPNCVFNITPQGEVRVSKGHHGPAFLAQSSIETEKDYGVQLCDTRVATITIANGKVYVDPSIGSMAGCAGPTHHWDAKLHLGAVFEGLSDPGQ